MGRFLSIADRKGLRRCSTGILPVTGLIAVFAGLALAQMPQWYLDKGLSTVDTDGDGIPDVWEKRTYGNPTVADSHLDRDGDGLTDLVEFWRRTDPRTFSTMGDLWSDGEKAAAGLDPLVRVKSAVDLEQWLAYLGWNAQLWLGWTAQEWLALHAPDENGFGRPYSGFIYNTLPYSDPSRTDTIDFWLKTRTDRFALATVGDRLSTNTFLVLPGERRYRIRAAKDGPVSLTLDPLPGNFADIPSATNGLWICEMALEPAQSNLVIFTAGSPPSVSGSPAGDSPQMSAVGGSSGTDGLMIEEEPEPGSFHPLVNEIMMIKTRHLGVTVGGDYAGTWCLCACSPWPSFASLNADAPGGVTLNGQAVGPDTPLLDKGEAVIPGERMIGVVTQSVASVEYPFLCQDILFWFAVCQGSAGGVRGVESDGGDGHTPTKPPDDALPGQCNWRGCECAIGLVTTVGFDHTKVNTRNLTHPQETPEDDRRYQHCLGIEWQSDLFNLTNLVESLGYDLTQYVKWEIDDKLQDSHELDLGDKAPDDLKLKVFRVKMVDKDNAKVVWDRIILVVNNEDTKTSFDNWYNRFSVETNWLAELPTAYSALGPWVTHIEWIPNVVSGAGGFFHEYMDFSDPEPTAAGLWDSPGIPGQFMHHTAKRQMRSWSTPGGHGHQVCYDDDGIMLLYGVSAGSADYGSTTSWVKVPVHIELDVDPFIRALQLDGNPCLQSVTALTHAIICQGENVGKYLQCRPSIPNNKRRLLPGEITEQ